MINIVGTGLPDGPKRFRTSMGRNRFITRRYIRKIRPSRSNFPPDRPGGRSLRSFPSERQTKISLFFMRQFWAFAICTKWKRFILAECQLRNGVWKIIIIVVFYAKHGGEGTGGARPDTSYPETPMGVSCSFQEQDRGLRHLPDPVGQMPLPKDRSREIHKGNVVKFPYHCTIPLPLPMGEVAAQGADGEGLFTPLSHLSVTAPPKGSQGCGGRNDRHSTTLTNKERMKQRKWKTRSNVF